MKKGLIELRTGRAYVPGLPKEEYAEEIAEEVIDGGFDVDYESLKKVEVIPIDFLKDLITEYEVGTNCEKMWATGLTCVIQKWKALRKRKTDERIFERTDL